jgi:hypothetical protein
MFDPAPDKVKRRHRRYTPSHFPARGHGCRSSADKSLSSDAEHEARIVAHMHRVERELARMAGVKHLTPEANTDVA